MNEIGAKLKARREELGFTLEEISTKTRIPIAQLKALEAGDLKYFHNDLSYLRYYVRFYCQALHLEFEPFRDLLSESIEGYTQSVSLKAINDRKEIQDNIDRRIHKKPGPKEAKLQKDKENAKQKIIKKKYKIKTKHRKIDYSLISLLAVIAIMIMSLVIVFMTTILPNFLLDKNEKPPVVSISPTPSLTIAPVTPTPTVSTQKQLSFKTVDPRNYEISNWNENEQVSIKVEFSRDTWTQVLYDGVATDNPAATTYKANERLEALFEAKKDLRVTIWLGYVEGNVIKINGQVIDLDPVIAGLKGSQKIHFTLKGE